MFILYLIIFFIFGLFMGSFYTVIGLRLPKHENFLTDRSHCDKCQHNLSLLDMIPLLSYLFLKGRCRYCKAKINELSTYMEFFTGVLFSLSFYVFGFSYELLIALGIVSLLIIVSVSDISYYIIPDEILIFFIGFFTIIITLNSSVLNALISLLSGFTLFIIMYTIMIFGNFLFKKESLGGGDVKMMFVFGLILNPFLGLISIFLASFLALPVSIFILLKKHQNLVPFGPFLLISFAFIYFTKIDMTTIINFIKQI
ncbi:MAG: prepilin peptidase [Bacilli bacterium]|nr:prepilin peptidase [Bacilli bacterium]